MRVKRHLLLGVILLVLAISVPLLHALKEGFQAGEGGEPPKAPTIDLVIARYKEDLSWLSEFHYVPFRRIIVYNKSQTEPKLPLKNMEVETLNNVGTCDHTYLYHIIKNYDNLADVTIFAPGSAHLFYKIVQFRNVISKVLQNKDTVLYSVFYPESLKKSVYDFTIPHYAVANPENRDTSDTSIPAASIRPFGKWFEKWFGPSDAQYHVTYRGIFAVTREHIRARPKSFYKELIGEVDKSRFSEEAHFIERSWSAIFNTVPSRCYYDLNKLFD